MFPVSIPFIAGQWSLLPAARCGPLVLITFQSPSLRGSGRFVGELVGLIDSFIVSIPFIAGQWSLP